MLYGLIAGAVVLDVEGELDRLLGDVRRQMRVADKSMRNGRGQGIVPMMPSGSAIRSGP